MMFSRSGYDACFAQQQAQDQQRIFSYNTNPLTVNQMNPGVQPNLMMNKTGSAQRNVEIESLMRNGAFIDSRNCDNREIADRNFSPYMMFNHGMADPATGRAAPMVDLGMSPLVEFRSRTNDPLSGMQYPRWDFLQHPMQGAVYGYDFMNAGTDTVQQFKDQLAAQRPKK